MKRTITHTLLLALAATACTGQDPIDSPSADLDPEDIGASMDGKAEAWDEANNPAFVDSTFLYHVTQLPLAGSGKKPIPSDYWAVASDNLNVKWDGEMSPAEKYARVFGKKVSDVQEAISRANGVKAHESNRECREDSDCESLKDGSACSTSYDGKMKRCIPTWWGICHGWAPYALREPQAKQPVTRTAADGTQVTFYPGDLEALMSLLYTDVDTKFLSSRCNDGVTGDSLPADNQGRIIHAPCRDMNPGSWHVLVTNMMGMRGTGFVLDQTTNYEVWNQPAWKYRITNPHADMLTEVTPAQAMALLGQPAATTYTFNASAKKLYDVKMDFTFVVESRPGREAHNADDYSSTKHYEYILEADANGKVIGGEWVAGSKTDHPDFAWWPTSNASGSVAGIDYASVKLLNDEAAGAPPAADGHVTLLDKVKLPDSFWTKSTYATLNLPAGFRKVTLRMTGTGDARLMVGPKGKNPVIGWFSSNLCDAHTSGSANQTCTFNVDASGGVYYVRVRNEGSDTTVTVVADEQR